jgi:hypothetical protein
MSKCKKCKYFQGKDWSFAGFHIFGMFGISHILNRVCGFCMDSENPDFNDYAKANGRGIGKLQAIFAPKWCRFKSKDEDNTQVKGNANDKGQSKILSAQP